MSPVNDQCGSAVFTTLEVPGGPRAPGALRQVLTALSAGLASDAGPQDLPGIFERELQRALAVRAIRLREIPPRYNARLVTPTRTPDSIVLGVPSGDPRVQAVLEASSGPDRSLDDSDHDVLTAAAHLGGLVLEAARGRPVIRSLSTTASLIGSTPFMQSLRERVERVAMTDFTVLIEGESGTGKELVARQLHDLSPRRRGPFVAVNCAAVVETLLEAELFGIEERTATGVRGRRGKFEHAHEGTLFLDEVSDLSAAAQAKLLRAIQEGEIERVGGAKPIKTDFRLIAATNVDIEKAVKDGRFREDLFYRINVIPIKLPPLRDRIEDLPQLARFFLGRYRARFRKNIHGISDSTLRILSSYWWPGNIRELENLIERLVAVSDKEWITDEDLPFEFHFAQLDRIPSRGESLFQEATNTFERNFILRALEKSGWNVTATARYLGIPLSTLKFKMDRLEIREIAKRLRGA